MLFVDMVATFIGLRILFFNKKNMWEYTDIAFRTTVFSKLSQILKMTRKVCDEFIKEVSEISTEP
jgi:hypothetical protein